MGTGTVIGSHTILTNTHFVETQYGSIAHPSNIIFNMNQNGAKKPYTFHASRIIKVPSYDMAIIHTKENMVRKSGVQPLRLASDAKIRNLKQGQTLYSLGYGFHPYTNTLPYWSKFKYLQKSSNQAEIMTKDIFRAGDSGSPMVNGNYEIFGLRTYGYNLRGTSSNAYARQEVSGGESLYGYPKRFIQHNMW